MPSEQASAVYKLDDIGALLVLCHDDGSPIDAGWRDTRPTREDLESHLGQNGWLIGLVPESIGFAVIHIEDGGIEAVPALKEALGSEKVWVTGRRGTPPDLWFNLPEDDEDRPTAGRLVWETGKGRILHDEFVPVSAPLALYKFVAGDERRILTASAVRKLAADADVPDADVPDAPDEFRDAHGAYFEDDADAEGQDRAESIMLDLAQPAFDDDALVEARRCLIPGQDPNTTYQRLRALEPGILRGARSAKQVLKRIEDGKPRSAVSMYSVKSEFPTPLLSPHGSKGAVLSAGTVCLLSGEGGIAKSALSLSIAMGVAALDDGARGEVSGKLFEALGGPVLMVTFEDPPGVTAWRARRLSSKRPSAGITGETFHRVHILDLAGRSLFGPTEDNSRGALYNARPGPLPGWHDLWRAAAAIKPKLIVIDPALAAYVGESNAAAPVREFLSALAVEADKLSAGILLVAHSNKDARAGKKGGQDPFDPGQVGGSAAWADGVRGVLTMTRKPETEDGEPGDCLLNIAKANYGPSRIAVDLDPVRTDNGAIVGFTARGRWETPMARKERTESNDSETNATGTNKSHRTSGVT